MLNDAIGFKKIYLAAGLSSVYFYPQLFIFLHNYRVNTFKAEDNYYLIPQSLANGHVSRISGEELKSALLDIARNMVLAQLQEFELITDGGNCPDNLEREIESLKKSKAHYTKLKFEIYDDYTKANITRDQMAKKLPKLSRKSQR